MPYIESNFDIPDTLPCSVKIKFLSDVQQTTRRTKTKPHRVIELRLVVQDVELALVRHAFHERLDVRVLAVDVARHLTVVLLEVIGVVVLQNTVRSYTKRSGLIHTLQYVTHDMGRGKL